MKQCNKILMLTIMASLMLSGCKVITNEPEETPEEIALPTKEVDFWNGEDAYKIDESRTVYLTNVEREDSETGHSKSIIEATIPEIVTNQKKEYTVTGLGEGAFMFCDYLQEVTLPDSIHEIDDYAFSECEDLIHINFSNELERIGVGAFSFTNLEQIELGEKVILIESGAFSYCDNIGKVRLNESLKKIESCAFIGCSKLSEVVISAKELEIGQETFAECESLKTFYVPKESLEYYQGVLSEYDAEVKTIEE